MFSPMALALASLSVTSLALSSTGSSRIILIVVGDVYRNGSELTADRHRVNDQSLNG